MTMTKAHKIQVARFAVVTALSFIAFEAAEHAVSRCLGIELGQVGTGAGWLLVVVAYGFKTHILCCLVPLLWAAYRCRHRACDHDHCEKHGEDGPEH